MENYFTGLILEYIADSGSFNIIEDSRHKAV
jgi:hypothetical protein